ncbi:hypothetical protein DFH08DRAFT_855334 [Mycena albidolilacea]|uniref:Uncharacterized protein n=1 Tax=Mycena albidolilacea TaxID=1033008 RepID=A0AAD7EXL7_9AGAR|nr:hypothetical protein DFH08DRAFT_855334 [Mycena albidolilacea]
MRMGIRCRRDTCLFVGDGNGYAPGAVDLEVVYAGGGRSSFALCCGVSTLIGSFFCRTLPAFTSAMAIARSTSATAVFGPPYPLPLQRLPSGGAETVGEVLVATPASDVATPTCRCKDAPRSISACAFRRDCGEMVEHPTVGVHVGYDDGQREHDEDPLLVTICAEEPRCHLRAPAPPPSRWRRRLRSHLASSRNRSRHPYLRRSSPTRRWRRLCHNGRCVGAPAPPSVVKLAFKEWQARRKLEHAKVVEVTAQREREKQREQEREQEREREKDAQGEDKQDTVSSVKPEDALLASFAVLRSMPSRRR